jgi:hypothetical protein
MLASPEVAEALVTFFSRNAPDEVAVEHPAWWETGA